MALCAVICANGASLGLVYAAQQGCLVFYAKQPQTYIWRHGGRAKKRNV